MTTKAFLQDRTFCLIVLGSGLIAGTSVSKAVHFFKLIVESGWMPSIAALLLSTTSMGGVVGALVFGALADRFNAGRTMMINAMVLAAAWTILILSNHFALLLAVSVMLGICISGFSATHGVLVARLYGVANFARALGLVGLLVMPFLVGTAPLVGLLREITGSYVVPVLMHVGGFVLAAFCFYLVGRREDLLQKDGGHDVGDPVVLKVGKV